MRKPGRISVDAYDTPGIIDGIGICANGIGKVYKACPLMVQQESLWDASNISECTHYIAGVIQSAHSGALHACRNRNGLEPSTGKQEALRETISVDEEAIHISPVIDG
jgi:hypothetical protein